MNIRVNKIFNFCVSSILFICSYCSAVDAQSPPKEAGILGAGSDPLWSVKVGKRMIGRFVPNGDEIFIPEMFGPNGYPKGRLKFLDAYTGYMLSTFSPCSGEEFNIYVYRRQWASFKETGNLMAVSCLSGGVELWNIKLGKKLGAFSSIGDEPAISPDGTRMVTSDVESSDAPELWNTESQQRISVLPGGTGTDWNAPLAVDFSSDSRLLAIAYYTRVCIWNAASGKRLVCFDAGRNHDRGNPKYASPESRIYDLAFTSDGETIVTGTGRSIKFWEVQTGKLKYESSEGHKALLNDLAISADENILATASKDRSIMLWDMKTGKLIRRLSKPKESTQEILFSPDGKCLLYRAWGSQRSIIYEVNTGRILWQAKYGTASHVISPKWDIVLLKDFENDMIRAYRMGPR